MMLLDFGLGIDVVDSFVGSPVTSYMDSVRSVMCRRTRGVDECGRVSADDPLQ